MSRSVSPVVLGQHKASLAPHVWWNVLDLLTMSKTNHHPLLQPSVKVSVKPPEQVHREANALTLKPWKQEPRFPVEHPSHAITYISMFLPFEELCALPLGQKYKIWHRDSIKWHRESTKLYIHAQSGKPALTSMRSGLSHWQDVAQFALNRGSAAHHGVLGRLFRWVRPLLDTLGIPGFGKNHDRGFNICLLAHALFLGPAPTRVKSPPSLRFLFYTQRAEILFSSPFFFGRAAAEAARCCSVQG